MFDSSLPGPAALCRVDDAVLVSAITGWMRASAAAEARAMVGIAELVRRRCTEQHPDWACDDWDAAAAEVSAALTVSHGRASGLMDLAVTLRDRLPKVKALFVAGDIDARMVATIADRIYLVHDQAALAELDETIAAHAVAWAPLSKNTLTQAIDVWVDSIDPGALRRTRANARQRDVSVGDLDEKSGTTAVWGRLLATDAALLDRRLKAMAHSVCDDDPRTLGQRRADALGALAAGSDHLACACGSPACPADPDDGRASHVMVHVVAEKDSLAAEVDPFLHGEDREPETETETEHGSQSARESRLRPHVEPEPPPRRAPQCEREPAAQAGPAAAAGPEPAAAAAQGEAEPGPETQPAAAAQPAPVPEPADAPEPEPTRISEPEPAPRSPEPPVRRKAAIIPGSAIVPAPLLADLIAHGATLTPLRTPGTDPEPRYRPSKTLDTFVRVRDLTCRFPGCDRPAEKSDLDHTVPYPQGLTHAGGLKCYCRKHHLIKTFWDGWTDQQHPDSTLVITTPTGLTYTTTPGATLLFPDWNTTTPIPPAPAAPPGTTHDPNTPDTRGLMMPKRKQTRAKTRQHHINTERALNNTYNAEHNRATPF